MKSVCLKKQWQREHAHHLMQQKSLHGYRTNILSTGVREPKQDRIIKVEIKWKKNVTSLILKLLPTAIITSFIHFNLNSHTQRCKQGSKIHLPAYQSVKGKRKNKDKIIRCSSWGELANLSHGQEAGDMTLFQVTVALWTSLLFHITHLSVCLQAVALYSILLFYCGLLIKCTCE